MVQGNDWGRYRLAQGIGHSPHMAASQEPDPQDTASDKQWTPKQTINYGMKMFMTIKTGRAQSPPTWTKPCLSQVLWSPIWQSNVVGKWFSQTNCACISEYYILTTEIGKGRAYLIYFQSEIFYLFWTILVLNSSGSKHDQFEKKNTQLKYLNCLGFITEEIWINQTRTVPTQKPHHLSKLYHGHNWF